jgi:hypothetical protein
MAVCILDRHGGKQFQAFAEGKNPPTLANLEDFLKRKHHKIRKTAQCTERLKKGASDPLAVNSVCVIHIGQDQPLCPEWNGQPETTHLYLPGLIIKDGNSDLSYELGYASLNTYICDFVASKGIVHTRQRWWNSLLKAPPVGSGATECSQVECRRG